MQHDGYEDFEIIGSGGNAHVYRARSLRTGADVAIKVLRGGGDSAVNRRFERERQFMADLGEIDGVVPVLESGTTAEGDPYIVMPLYTGGSLQTELERGPIPWRKSVEIARQISDALTIAHERRILHLDVKPANVLLDEEGKAWLADFGIAETVGSTASMSAAMITPAFTPPERLRNTKPSEHTDIYGVCALLFALAAGEAPFGSGQNNTTPAAVMLSVLSDPVPVDRLPPNTNPHLVNLLRRGMAKNIDERPQSARELSDLLTDVLAGRLVTPPLSAVSTTTRPPSTDSDIAVRTDRGSLASTPDVPARTPTPTSALAIRSATAVAPRPEPDRPGVWILAAFIALFIISAGAAFALIGTDRGEGTSAAATEHPIASSDEQSATEPALDGTTIETAVSTTQEVRDEPPETTEDSDLSGGLANDDTSLGGSVEVDPPTTAPATSVAATRPTTSVTTTTAAFSSTTESTRPSSTIDETSTSTSSTTTSSTSTSTSTSTTSTSTSTSTSTTTTTTTTIKPVPVLEAGLRAAAGPTGDEQTITFTNITNGDATSYSWDFGDGHTTTTVSKTSVTHTYDTPGTYRVTIVARANDISDDATHTVRVAPNTPPEPVLEAGLRATKGPEGHEQTITFTNITNGDATSYSWDFGDGHTTTTATKTSVTHTYDAPGTYSVTITATAPDATDSATHTVRVDPNTPPEAPDELKA